MHAGGACLTGHQTLEGFFGHLHFERDLVHGFAGIGGEAFDNIS